MKLQTFLKKVRGCHGGSWILCDDGSIRFESSELPNLSLCPITAVLYIKTGDVVASQRWGVAYVAGTNRDLELRKCDAKAVIFASDKLKGYSKKLRQQLLDACGLEE